MMALLLLFLGVSILSLQDSTVKLIAPQTSFWQVQVVRSAFNLVIVCGLAMLAGGLALLWPRRFWPAAARAMLLALCMGFFFGAAQQVSVTQMATGLYTYPLFVTLLAGPLLGERIGVWRFGALALGAVGCGFVLNPFADAFTIYQVVPVFAGFFYACNILVLRRYCSRESPLALAFVVNLIFIVTGCIGALVMALLPMDPAVRGQLSFFLTGWPELTAVLVAILAGLAVLNLFGNLFLSRAYQTADSSLLAPLDFSYLLLVALWGRLLFDSWPTPLAILGMSMIAAAGMITAIREQRRQHYKSAGQEPG